MSQQNVTTIRVLRQTHERLLTFGKMGETFDTMLNRLLDEVEKR